MATTPGDNRPRRTTGAVAPAQVQKKPSGAAPTVGAKISARVQPQKPAAPVSSRLVPQAKAPAPVASRPVPKAAPAAALGARPAAVPPVTRPAAAIAPIAPKVAPKAAPVAPAAAPAPAVKAPKSIAPTAAAKVETPAPPPAAPAPAPAEPVSAVAAVLEQLKANQAEVITSAQLPPAIKKKQSTHRLAEKIAENLPAPASESAALPTTPAGPNVRFWKMASAFLAVGCVVLMIASACLYFGRDASIAPLASAATPGGDAQAAPEARKDPAAIPVVQPEPAPAANAGTPVNLLRGATGSGCEHPERLTDGEFSNYGDSDGYAHYDMGQGNKWKNGMVVTLQKPVKLSRIRFLLWDKDDRTYRYMVDITPDGKKWKPISEDKKPQRSWQEIRFEPQEVLAVRIKGLDNSKNNSFHVVEVEGYGAVVAAPKRAPPTGYVSELALKPGLWAQYFDGVGNYPTITDVPTLCRVEPTVVFNNGQGFIQSAQSWPMGGACAATFSGFIKVEQEALHTFFIESDDGSRLYINGELVADNDGSHSMTELWGQIDLKPGLHRIWVEYYNVTGPMGLNVSVKLKNSDKKKLDPRQLLHNPAEATRK